MERFPVTGQVWADDEEGNLNEWKMRTVCLNPGDSHSVTVYLMHGGATISPPIPEPATFTLLALCGFTSRLRRKA